jgi:acetylornithine deacetylase/succinyl-diaminopimelate desuccinylase-like protein
MSSAPGGGGEPDLDRVRSYLETHRDRHLSRLQTLLRQPSVSVDGVGGEACARLFVDLLRDAGFPEAALVPTEGPPGVWAAYDAGAPVTLAVYGMLDVRSAPPEGWRSAPFAAEVTSGNGFPQILVARGARAAKGPLGVWLNAVEASHRVLEAPPVNLLLLAESDEILGSPAYRSMFEKFRDRLNAADACWSPGASQDAQGRAHVTLGYKGMIFAAIRSSGRAWGRGPRERPAHGMAKSVIDNPAWRLVQALSTLTEDNGNSVRLEGFDPDPGPVTEEEAAEMEALRRRFSGAPWQQVLPGVQGGEIPAIAGLDGSQIFRRYLFGPSFNLNGLRSGYTGPGTPTFTIPHVAEAFFDIRIPRTWDAHAVLAAIRTRLDAGGFRDVEIDVRGAFNGSGVPRDAPILAAAEGMFRAHGVEVVRWPMSGGGGPWSLFAHEFGIPVFRDVGLGHGQALATDEYLVIEGSGKVAGMVDMAISYVELMQRLAAQ